MKKDITEQIEETKGLVLQVTSRSIIARLRQDGINLERFTTEVARIGEFFFQKLFRLASQDRKSRGPKKTMRELKRNAVSLAICSAANVLYLQKKEAHPGLEAVDTLEKAENAIFVGSGLSAMNEWLKNQGGKKDRLLEASGKERFIKSLLALSTTSEAVLLYEKPVVLRKYVISVFNWLKMVSALEKQSETKPYLFKLSYTVGQSMNSAWSQEKTYLNLIIAMTLKTDKVSFTLAQINDFCNIIKQKSWEKDIREELSSVLFEGVKNTTFIENETIKEILKNLLKKENQTVFYFFKRLSFAYGNDEKSLKEADKIMTAAVVFAAESAYSSDSEWRTRDIQKQMRATFGLMSAINLFKFIAKYPYFLKWLSKEALLRLVILDNNKGELSQFIEKYGEKESFEKIKLSLAETTTPLEVLNKLFLGSDFCGVKLDFLIKNYNLHKKQKTPLGSDAEKKSLNIILTKIISCLTANNLSQWIVSIEKNKDTLPVNSIPLSRVAAAYISTPKLERAMLINEIMSQQEWSKYLNDEALLFFQSRVSTELKRFEFLKSKSLRLYH